MNCVNSGWLGRYGRSTFWYLLLIKDTFHSVPSVYFHDKTARHIDLRRRREHYKEERSPVNWALWTQLRYKKFEYPPRLHRDIEQPNFDDYRKDEFKDVRKTTYRMGDDKYGFTYIVGFFGLMGATYGLKSELTHFITYMAPAADVLAMASVDVNISKVTPGQCITIKWRGKPLFVKRRTSADIDVEAKTAVASLRDPETPEQRAPNQEWLVVIGICTHLGCVPIPNSGEWPGGFYCPCHGSHYDNLGRIRKGPAPLNLEIPPYKFVSDSEILVG